MKQKRGGGRFLKIVNSKPVIGALIFIMLSLATVLAGNIIVKEGSMEIGNNLNSSGILFVNSSNVGIGTTAPTRTLDVRGQGNFSGTIYINNATDISVWGTLITNLDTSNYWNRSGTSIFLRYLGDNIGIGTIAPAYKLEIANSAIALNVSGRLYVNSSDVYIGGNRTQGYGIISNFTNVNGTCLRYADGTQECYGNYSSVTCNSIIVSPVYYGSTLITFPVAFNAVPVVTIGVIQNSGVPWIGMSQAVTASNFNVYIMCAISGTTGYPTYIAIGRWK